MQSTNPSSISVVVLNNHCRAQGGASRVAIDEAVDLAGTGVEVVFVGAVGPVSPELGAAPLRTICLGQRELAKSGGSPAVMFQGLWNGAAYRATRNLLLRLDRRRTIVHLHGFTQALSTSPVRCAVDLGFRVIYTMHDFFAACPTGAFFDFGSSTPCLRRALSIDCITTNCDKRRYVHKLYRVARSTVQIQAGGLPRRVRDYIALSRRSEEILRPYLPPDAHVHLLENPVGVPKSPPVKVGENDAMVVVGRLDPEKGIHVLLAAARRTGTRLTLIGDGPLRQIAEASGLCRVTGWLPREAVLAELESARCLVFPSLWYETYGLAVAEAAARGIPAIVSDISAAAERVRDGVDGWHARAGSVDDLERCLHIASDNAAVQVTGREAYARYWSDPPTRENHAVRLIKVYASVLGRVEHE